MGLHFDVMIHEIDVYLEYVTSFWPCCMHAVCFVNAIPPSDVNVTICPSRAKTFPCFLTNFKLYSLLLLTALVCLVQRNEHVELRQPALTEDFFGEALSALSCADTHCQSFLGREL
jgi:hypothetical protein